MSQQARIAVIGTGWWATTAHLPTLRNHPDAVLVAIADQRPQTLAAAAAKYGVQRTYTDYREMLDQEELDGVIIAVWHAAHYEVARACLERGLHVLLEKPMVLQAAHARDLIRLASDQNRELIVGYPWNYTPLATRARAVVQSGALGEVQYANSVMATAVVAFLRGEDETYRPVFDYPVSGPGAVYADPTRSGGGFGYLQVTHAMGGLFFVTGLQPAVVSAFMNNQGLAVDVVNAMIVQCANGALISAGGTGAVHAEDSGKLGLEVHGADGWLDIDFQTGAGRIVHPNLSVEQLPTLTKAEERYPQHSPATNLIQVILGRAPNGSPPEPAWRTVEFLEAAYRSAVQGGMPVAVDQLYPESES